MPGGNIRLCMLNRIVSMCDLLLPTGFKRPNVIAIQRCNNVLELMVKVFDFIIIIKIYFLLFS